MPALIAVFGEPGAAAAARRAAVALRRRESHRVEVVSLDSGRGALGCVGDRVAIVTDTESGLVVAVDGEVVAQGGLVRGADAAAALLRRFALDEEHAEIPDGHFAAVVWNPRSRRLRLVTDRLGQRPLYVAREAGAMLVAGEIKALLELGVQARIDLDAWAQFLAFEYMLGDRSPLDGVRLVPPGSVATVRDGEIEDVREYWRYRVEPAPSGREDMLLAELSQLLEGAVRRRLDPDTALALSGGLDSRAIATAAVGRSPGMLAATYGAAGADDLVLGRRVALRLGLRHRRLVLEPGFVARGAAETVWLTEGQVRAFHVHHLRLRALREEGIGSVLIGFLGDGLLRGGGASVPEGDERSVAMRLESLIRTSLTPELESVLLTPSFLGEIRGRAHVALVHELAREEGDTLPRLRQFVWRHEARRKILPATALFADDIAPRDPLADAELVDFCRTMPEWARMRGRLESAYLARFSAAARIRSPKYGVAPTLAGRRKTLALRLVHERRRARSFVERRVGVALLPNRAGIGDYAADIRRDGRDLLGVLLEPRTLDRGQLREEGVRRLVAETLAGRARNTKPLGVLLTLELFQRQFVDGDGAPSGSAIDDVALAESAIAGA